MPEPFTTPETKAHLRVKHDDEDGLIDGLIVAAREWVENFTGQILVRRDVTQRLDRLDARLYAWPIADDATLSVTYLDSAGDAQAVTDARLVFGNGWASIAPAFGSSWPTIYSPAVVTVEAGYATAEDVPQALKQAMLLLIGHWYETRSGVSEKASNEVPFAVESLCRPYRQVIV